MGDKWEDSGVFSKDSLWNVREVYKIKLKAFIKEVIREMVDKDELVIRHATPAYLDVELENEKDTDG